MNVNKNLNLLHVRLKEARKKAGYSSREVFATEHKINPTTYKAHETAKRKATLETLLWYSKILNVSPAWLILGNNKDKDKSYDSYGSADFT